MERARTIFKKFEKTALLLIGMGIGTAAWMISSAIMTDEFDGPKVMRMLEARAREGSVAGILLKNTVDVATMGQNYTDPGSELIASGAKTKSHFALVNDTDNVIRACFTKGAAANCVGDDLYLPMSSAAALDGIAIGDKIFVKKEAGGQAGTVWVGVW